MRDQADEETVGVRVWTTNVRTGEAEGLLSEISKSAQESGSKMLVLKGNLVFGVDHARSALFHARKSILEKRNASDSLAMETLLYLSGERQLSSAIGKMSVDNNTANVAIVSLGGTEFSPGHNWTEMPRIPPTVNSDDLKRFGISDSELGTVPTSMATELVLEKVAAVDVLKK